jgi:hypothetical protein
MVLAQKAEGEFIGDDFAFAARSGRQQLLDAHGRNTRRGMRCEPGRVAATGALTRHIDEILDGKLLAVEWAGACWRQCEPFDECAA